MPDCGNAPHESHWFARRSWGSTPLGAEHRRARSNSRSGSFRDSDPDEVVREIMPLKASHSRSSGVRRNVPRYPSPDGRGFSRDRGNVSHNCCSLRTSVFETGQVGSRRPE